MATLTEGIHTGEFFAGEANNTRSRDDVVVASGQNLESGAVLGRGSYGVGRVSIPAVVGTGNGTASLVSAGKDVEIGSYVVTLKTVVAHGGVFSVVAPSGLALPDLTLTAGSGNTTAYASDHINFSVTDGSTDFIVGDVFTFVVGTTAPTVIGGTGTGTISLISLGPDAKPGNYRVINREAITHGGRFEVIDPDGESLGDNFLMSAGSGNVTAFVTDQIRFSLTDATDFILGNYFDVAVFSPLAGGSVVAWDPTATTGAQIIRGVLLRAVDATAGALDGVAIARDAVVLKGPLQWKAGVTAAQKEAAYLDMRDRLGIVARDSVSA